MYDVAVVGAGLFGSIAADALARAGKSVVIIDDARPDRGSAPAGCVIRPEWISSMKGKPFEEGLRLLDELYGVQDIKFELWPLRKAVKCFRVEPEVILNGHGAPELEMIFECPVTEVQQEDSGCRVTYSDPTYSHKPTILEAKHVILACGIWAHELFEGVEVSGRYGWSWRGTPVAKPTIRPWAPYRQVVSFNMDDGNSWRGDGQALIEKSVNDTRLIQSRDRCFPDPVERVIEFNPLIPIGIRGARPYVKDLGGKPCFYKRRGNVWCITGGGKNGTISAAWAARRLVEEIC